MNKLNYKDFNEVFAFIIPTGIGASIGGYAGDGSFWARKFSSIRPTIVNPNVVNGACFSGINSNMLYLEGWALDEFFAGNIGIIPSQNNKIGIIFDKAIPNDVLNIHINTINAVKTIYGVDIIGYEITKDEVGVEYNINETGASSGCVQNPETLVEAGKILIERGAQALAIVCLFPEETDAAVDKNYSNGIGVDPIGGVESIISHYVSSELIVPCVHAPAFIDYQIKTDLVNEKASAEYITPTFLPCLLLGLQNAPLLKKVLEKPQIIVHNIKALIVPSTALGSSAVLDAIEKNIPIYAVKENKTVLNVTKDAFLKKDSIIEIETYEELYKILEQKYEK